MRDSCKVKDVKQAAEFPEIENLLINLNNKVNLTALFNNNYQLGINDLESVCVVGLSCSFSLLQSDLR